MTQRQQDIHDINDWLITEGRLSGDAVLIVKHYVEQLRSKGVPVSRARIAQRLSNPLLAAWGMIWTPEKVHDYTVPRTTLSTGAWHGSPFEYVVTNNVPLHKSLQSLSPEDHQTYRELAEAGGKDFYATVLEYGDGSRQACSYVTERDTGFSADDLTIIERTRAGLASALEPTAMRRSAESLLTTYLGTGPANAVIDGSIQRGESVQIEAAIMFADMRGFTEKSMTWPEAEFLSALDDFFETVVEAVHAHSGDVLKLLGDGVLAIFPKAGSEERCCVNAVAGAQKALAAMTSKNEARSRDGKQPIAAGFGLSFGPVTYGNIGSPDRLDFTVVGAAVNRASRIQDLCKTIGWPILMADDVARRIEGSGILIESLGSHELRGIGSAQAVFTARGG